MRKGFFNRGKCVFAVILIVVITFSVQLTAQESQKHLKDSLLRLLKFSPERLKSRIYLDLSELYLNEDTISGKKYAFDALELAEQNNNHLYKAKASFKIGLIYFKQDSTVKAKHWFQKAIKTSKDIFDDYDDQVLVELLGLSYFYKASCNMRYLSDSIKKVIYEASEAIYYLKETTKYDILAEAYVLLGRSYIEMNDVPKGLEELHKAVNIYQVLDDKRALAELYNNISYYYDRHESLEYCHKAISLYSEIGDSLYMAEAILNMVYFSHEVIGVEQSIDYYNMVLDILEKHNDNPLMIYACLHIGSFYDGLPNESETARKYFLKGIKIGFEHNLNKRLAHLLVSMAGFCKNMKELDSAYYYFHLADSVTKVAGYSSSRARYFTQFADFLSDQKQYRRALENIKKGLELAKMEKTDPYLEKNTYRRIISIYKSLGDYENALRYYEQYISLKDSIFNTETERTISAMQIKFDTDHMESELEIMKQKEKLKNAELRKKQIIIYSTSVALVLILGLTFFLIRQNRNKKRAYDQLMEKNLLLVNSGLNRFSKNKPSSNNSELSPELQEKILKKLDYQVKQKKIYLNKDVHLIDLAKKCSTNPSYLSKIINSHYRANFTGFINELRIKEAQKLMSDAAYRSFSIEGIAETVGFKSKSVFNVAFKKYTGVTPSYFISYLEKK